MKEFLSTSVKNTTLINFPSQNNTIFCLCSCKNEILYIDYDQELKSADLCIYNSPSIYLSFWHKIRHTYKLWFHGSPYSDQIILDKNQLISLKIFLDSI